MREIQDNEDRWTMRFGVCGRAWQNPKEKEKDGNRPHRATGPFVQKSFSFYGQKGETERIGGGSELDGRTVGTLTQVGRQC
jgi:hypothetical protein